MTYAQQEKNTELIIMYKTGWRTTNESHRVIFEKVAHRSGILQQNTMLAVRKIPYPHSVREEQAGRWIMRVIA